MNPIAKLIELVKRFERRCRLKDCKVIGREDVIEKNKEFHNILWSREIHPSTFKRIGTSEKVAIQDFPSYRQIEISYNTWVCSSPLSDRVKKIVAMNPKLLQRNAIYDLSKIQEQKTVKKLNKTDSKICKDFESFLKEEYGLEVEPIQMMV